MLELVPAHPENPGFLLRCEHPTHGICMIHVGSGTPGDIGAAMARCGVRPLDVSLPLSKAGAVTCRGKALAGAAS